MSVLARAKPSRIGPITRSRLPINLEPQDKSEREHHYRESINFCVLLSLPRDPSRWVERYRQPAIRRALQEQPGDLSHAVFVAPVAITMIREVLAHFDAGFKQTDF